MLGKTGVGGGLIFLGEIFLPTGAQKIIANKQNGIKMRATILFNLLVLSLG
jgi:hypothetical protein